MVTFSPKANDPVLLNAPIHLMLSELLTSFGHTPAFIANKIGVNKKTIDRILNKTTRPSIKTEMNLINFYCSCISSDKEMPSKQK